MLDRERLLEALWERGVAAEAAAKALKMSPDRFYAKLETGGFGIDEADRLVKEFNIENPGDIFFPKK